VEGGQWRTIARKGVCQTILAKTAPIIIMGFFAPRLLFRMENGNLRIKKRRKDRDGPRQKRASNRKPLKSSLGYFFGKDRNQKGERKREMGPSPHKELLSAVSHSRNEMLGGGRGRHEDACVKQMIMSHLPARQNLPRLKAYLPTERGKRNGSKQVSYKLIGLHPELHEPPVIGKRVRALKKGGCAGKRSIRTAGIVLPFFAIHATRLRPTDAVTTLFRKKAHGASTGKEGIPLLSSSRSNRSTSNNVGGWQKIK